jgi:hypothetical protein
MGVSVLRNLIGFGLAVNEWEVTDQIFDCRTDAEIKPWIRIFESTGE